MYELNAKFDNFIFDGIDANKRYKLIRCHFDSSEDTFSGGEIENTTYKSRHSNVWHITSSEYSSQLTLPLSFCKCDGSCFDYEEMRKINRWLSSEKNGYKLLQLYDRHDGVTDHASENLCYECKSTGDVK